MRKQFDIVVYPTKEIEPPIEDDALGWFASKNINDALPKTSAEWIIIAHQEVKITKTLLDQIAKACLDFPAVDCFTPSEESQQPLSYVAAPSPYLMVVTRRIIQRTGAFDLELGLGSRFLDLGLRMYHAGGQTFAIPLFSVSLKKDLPSEKMLLMNPRDVVQVLYKNLGIAVAFSYLIKHPKVIFYFLKNFRACHQKRKKAISLSKVSDERLQELYKAF